MKTPIIVALDNMNTNEASMLAEKLAPFVSGFKINHNLLFNGISNINWVLEYGNCMIDLKLHDVPKTNLSIINNLSSRIRPGIWDHKHKVMVTVHCANGSISLDMLKNRTTYNVDIDLLGITLLTSIDEWDSEEIFGPGHSCAETIESMMDIALMSGLNGIVCSGRDLFIIDEKDPGHILERYCPGIRMNPDYKNSRESTPKEAIKNGADYIIIGRQIIESKNPIDEIKLIMDSINE